MNRESGTVFTGKTPITRCVMAIITGLSSPSVKETTLRIYGWTVGRAAGVAGTARGPFPGEPRISRIASGTDEM